MPFPKVYEALVNKAEKKGRTKAEDRKDLRRAGGDNWGPGDEKGQAARQAGRRAGKGQGDGKDKKVDRIGLHKSVEALVDGCLFLL